MKQTGKNIVAHFAPLTRELNCSPLRLLGTYTLLFALFFVAVLSPFLVYGRTFLMTIDGYTQHVPSLTFFRQWLKTILQNFNQGKIEVPFWSMWVGFGENTITTAIWFRFLYILSLLFSIETMESFFVLRLILRLYSAGLAYIAFAKTRVKNYWDILLGCMIYLFSGFVLYYGPRYSFFVTGMIDLPLLLLGVDRIFEKKWSWLFILVVFMEGFCGFYILFMVTIASVVYALFRYFELSPERRMDCGGFGRILLRHICQYALGLGLAALGLLPMILKFFESSRAGADSGLNLWHWNVDIYLSYIRGLVDSHNIAYEGYIAFPSIALIGTFYLLYTRKKRNRLVSLQIVLYHIACLVPALTMLFSAMAGRRMRWNYILVFWTSIGVASAMAGLRKDDGRAFRVCAVSMGVYALAYLCASAWIGESVSLSLIVALLGLGVFYVAILTPWSHGRRSLATALLFAWLLVELTTKSYEMYSPQYDNTIAEYAESGKIAACYRDNAATAFEMLSDDTVYRTDVIAETRSKRTFQADYGQRSRVNGVSSYYSMLYGHISDYSLSLGNAHQSSNHAVMDLDQRTVMNALAGVKYAAALKDALKRVPFGYELIKDRGKLLSDGTKTREYLFKNSYSLPVSYAYEKRVRIETYDALPANRREQAMLQGVVLEQDVDLPEASLEFDDRALLDCEAILAVIREKAEKDEDLEITGNVLSIKRDNYVIDLPVDQTEGEIYLSFRNVLYKPFNYFHEKAERLAEEGASRLKVSNMERKARQWRPSSESMISVSCGDLSDQGVLLGPDHFGYLGARDMLINLGYGELSKTLKIKFSSSGKYTFDSIDLIIQPMDNYANKISALQANQADSVEIDGNRVTVQYNLNRDAFACLAIPYSQDWSATVDGDKAELLRANGMYMGVKLKKGKHTIVITCRMRGFWLGCFVSLGTLILLICIAILRKRERPTRLPDDCVRRH